MLLPEYSYELISSKPVDFNPMSFNTETELSFEVDEKTKQFYNNKLYINARYDKYFQSIKNDKKIFEPYPMTNSQYLFIDY